MKAIESGELISKFIDVHGNKYDYSHVIYKNMRTKISIKCFIHGLFEQTPVHHLQGSGCRKCANQIINVNNGKSFSQQKFIEIINSKHIPNLSFEKSIYKGKRKDIIVTCSIHGDYVTKAEMLLKGNGCKKCASNKLSIDRIKNNNEFVNQSIQVHGNIYNYELVNYTGSFNKVKIFCKKHQEYFEQIPCHHLKGTGCPLCKLSKGELKIIKILNTQNIEYIRQKTFGGLKLQRSLKFDFYLPDYNACIEFDGEQHFKIIENHWGDEQGFIDLQLKDKMKTEYCYIKHIPLLRIRFDNNNLQNTIVQFIESIHN